MVRRYPPHIKHAGDEFFVNLREFQRSRWIAMQDPGPTVSELKAALFRRDALDVDRQRV
jgi:hypothetical protein